MAWFAVFIVIYLFIIRSNEALRDVRNYGNYPLIKPPVIPKTPPAASGDSVAQSPAKCLKSSTGCVEKDLKF